MNHFEKKLPVGIENFEKIRTEGFYYIDKTGMIVDLLQKWGEVNLFTRPRRFGKSLNMSMLRAFFEIGGNREIFDGLRIAEETTLCEQYMGRFPVISISLKDVEGDDFAAARSMLCSVIGSEALRFQFLTGSGRLTENEKEMYRQLTVIDGGSDGVFAMSEAVLTASLKTLSMLLHKHYGSRVIILIDEYDVPLAKANEKGYYEQMVTLLRKMFGNVLKTNDHLYFAVLTGCLRIAKESIFTGLNNMKVMTISDVQYDEYFGFTDEEVRALLRYYEISDAYDIMKEWYDGYHFGDTDIYCPWDVICYCDKLRSDRAAAPGNYWSNTSSNDIVRHFIDMADAGAAKHEIERLIAGEAVVREIHEELTYKELYDSMENVWSVLFSTGYLTQQGRTEGDFFRLVIPNREIRNLFTGQIMKMFREHMRKDGEAVNRFCEPMKRGDADGVEKQFTEYLKKTISIRDTFVRRPTKENFYHGILLGILGFKASWIVTSNRESGDGYSDIQIQIEDEEIGIAIEVKYAQSADLEAECRKALEQIEMRDYAQALRAEGMKTIWKYAIACYKKRCRVMVE
ncbi:MAG: AAA family ATPase [Lachnospiraceae bacterium]|nr:AAA family ATPase [Lachnospiraceae bacterium]